MRFEAKRCKMNYWKFICATDNAEILTAFLSQLEFDSFEETENGLHAYLPERALNEEFEKQLTQVQQTFPFTFRKEFIKWENWNKKWEDNFTPIIVDDFCGIRATFHEPLENVKHKIIINPKMAFGTGHHETTRLVINGMKDVDFKDKSVLDYGCGTGVLAFLAEKLGASELIGVDIEQPAFENAKENAQLNQMQNIQFFMGTLDDIPTKTFDRILANINRNVLLDSIPTLKQLLNPNGVILFSGILEQDLPIMNQCLSANDLNTQKTLSENNWMMLHVTHA